MKLPVELKCPKKGLINIKKKKKWTKWFSWCYVRPINPVKIHPEKITKKDKKLANNLKYDRIDFRVQEKDFSKIEKKYNICINVFCCQNSLVFLIYVSNQKFEDPMDLLHVIDGDKSHCVKKDFNRFMFHKKKKIKK